MPYTHSTFRLVVAALLAGAVGALAGCAAPSNSGGQQETTRPSNPDLRNAAVHLAEHQVPDARSDYEKLAQDDTVSPRLRARGVAGRALTNLMLLPGSQAANQIWTGHLGADSEVDAQKAIYADEGYLYWRSQGARWERSGSAAGISELIADRLPWSAEELGSLSALMAGLTAPVGEARPDLLDLAERLDEIREDIRTVLNTEGFRRIVIPGETFRDVQLTLRLGKSELAAIGAIIDLARGAIFYAAAYKYEWSADSAFTTPESSYTGEPGEEWTSWDYTLKYLDRRWFRERARLPDQALYQRSRFAFSNGINLARESIEYGLENRNASYETLLDWRAVDPDYAQKWRTFLDTIENSLDNPAVVPFTEHPKTGDRVRVNATELFDNGRILADIGVEWLVPSDDTSRDTPSWVLGDEALQRFFVNGLFDPGFSLADDGWPKLQSSFGGDRFDTFRETLLSDLNDSIDNSYLENR